MDVSRQRSGAWFVVGSAVSVQAGQALAKLGFPYAPPVVFTALRFGFGALVLWLVFRPSLPRDMRTWGWIAALGSVMIGANLFLYESVARISLGVAVTMQFLGPLTVALIGSRRVRHVLWAALAAVGVVVINYAPGADVSWSGVGFALVSAACFGGYVVLSARVGARTEGSSGITWATAWAALFTVPLGLVVEPQAFASPKVLVIGLGVAVLCSVVANSLEFHALRRIPARVFGVLVSLEPAVAALAGLVVLGELLAARQWLAVVAIVAASVAVALDSREPANRTHQVVNAG